MARQPNEREQVFAVVRIDDFLEGVSLAQHRIALKEIVRSLEIAQREVARLSELNENKGCRYFWVATRLFPPGESFGTHADEDGP